VGLEHIEPNSGQRIGSAIIDLGNLTGRKPTFRRGQIVYGYLRPYLNKVWVADFDGYSSVDQFAFGVRSDLAITGFIAAFMRSETFLRRASIVTTTGQLPRIGTEEIAAVPIELPPLDAQHRIVAVLEEQERAANEARRASVERGSAADNLHSALLRATFEAPTASHWRRTRLGAVARVTGGIQKTPGRKPTSHHCPYLTVRNVQRGSLDLTEVERFEVSPAELERLRLVQGDLLIVEGNGSPDQIGRNAIFDLDGTDWIHQNHVIRVRLARESASYEFVSLFLNSPQGKNQMLERARSTSGLFTLSVGKIESLEVPLPPLPQQMNVVRELNSRIQAAERLVDRCREEAEMIGALPAAVLRAAFPAES
jgi:type I restriction enzyme S subunit